MNANKAWFDVDRKGLEKVLGRRGAEFMLYELVQNAWDQNVTDVAVTISAMAGKPQALLTVEDDDPDGFRDISHAFTLFAESGKKGDAEKRGRFNFGEKLVLARCIWAEIISTQHAIRFDEKGRHALRKRTDRGTRFTAQFGCQHDEIAAIERAARRLLVPAHIRTTMNGVVLPARKSILEAKATLPTEVADTSGVLKRTNRVTKVNFYRPIDGEEPWLYEMGIPICSHNGKYHYDVGQKVPLGLERDLVSASYMEKLHVLAFNLLSPDLAKADVTTEWVKTATESEMADPKAITRFMDLTFGEKRVAYDPSDPEANKLAVASGYNVVSGGMMGKTAWANAKAAEAILPAGQVTPSPKPYSPGGPPLHLLPADAITPDMRRIEGLAKKLAKALIGKDIKVTWADEPKWGVAATFGPGGPLVLNAGGLGKEWLTVTDAEASEDVLSLLIHEFGHEYESDHLSRGYYRALTMLGARLAKMAAKDPRLICYDGR